MAARKKAAAKKKAAPKKATGSAGLLNSNQRKQLESLGYIDKTKKRRSR